MNAKTQVNKTTVKETINGGGGACDAFDRETNARQVSIVSMRTHVYVYYIEQRDALRSCGTKDITAARRSFVHLLSQSHRTSYDRQR